LHRLETKIKLNIFPYALKLIFHDIEDTYARENEKKSAMSHVLFQQGRALEIVHPYGYQGDAEGAKKLLLECKQMYAKV